MQTSFLIMDIKKKIMITKACLMAETVKPEKRIKL